MPLLYVAALQVTSDQIFRDLSAPKFEWDRPNYSKSASHILENVQVCFGSGLGASKHLGSLGPRNWTMDGWNLM